MSKPKEIIIEINEDGTVNMEAIGFEGQACSLTLDEIARAIGSKTSETKKAEYFKKKQTVNQQVRR